MEEDDPSTRRGFDALRNNGYARSEVTAIRAYFSAQVREVSQSGLPKTGLLTIETTAKSKATVAVAAARGRGGGGERWAASRHAG